MAKKNYWLFKSEPGSYSIDDLKKDKTTFWDGIRNYQARNTIRDDIKEGDGVLFYHSNTDVPAIVGTAKVVKEAYPDHTQFDKKNSHYDEKSTQENPRWFMVDIAFDKKFSTPIPLEDVKAHKTLSEMVLAQRSRLSVQPVTKKEWDVITKLGMKE